MTFQRGYRPMPLFLEDTLRTETRESTLPPLVRGSSDCKISTVFRA